MDCPEELRFGDRITINYGDSRFVIRNYRKQQRIHCFVIDTQINEARRMSLLYQYIAKKAESPFDIRINYYRYDISEIPDGATENDVRFKHYWRSFPQFTPTEKGGACSVVLSFRNEQGYIISRIMGYAVCSLQDNFSYQEGRELAFKRALEVFTKMNV